MIAYLDNSATTRPTDGVIEAMTQSMRGGYFNPSSLYAPAIAVEKSLNACREKILRAIGAPGGEVLFTSGGTEANNLALLGAVAAMHGPQRILVSSVEHPSVLASCEELKKGGHEVVVFPVDGAGQPDWAFLESALTEKTALVSCMQVNNETGATPDLMRLSEMTRRKSPKALLHADGVQGFLRVPLSARLIDLYTLSSHKIHGPKGVGALWARPGVRLLARNLGGGQQDGLRSGTENTPGILGLSRAIEDMPADAPERLRILKALLLSSLKKSVPDLIVNGPDPDRAAPHILNVSFPGVRGEVMLHALEGAGVYVSTGSACSSKKRKLSPVLLSMGIAADTAECALRFSLSPHTAPEEILYAAEQSGLLYEQLRRFKRR